MLYLQNNGHLFHTVSKVELDGSIVKNVKFTGGCQGNLHLKRKGRKNMSIINKNKICLNYLIGVLICGFVIYANYIYKMENGTGYTTIVSFALLISVTTLSIFNKNNRL